MPLFIAHLDRGQPASRRVMLGPEIEAPIEGIFEEQYRALTDDIVDEIPFVREYQPGTDELLTLPIDAVPGVQLFLDTVNDGLDVNPLGRDDPAAISTKALFMRVQNRILVQQFTVKQVLNRRFLLGLRGDTYRRVNDTTLALGTSLTFIVEDDLIKFKHFQNMRSIMEMGDVYRAVTEVDVRRIANHPRLLVEDEEHFVGLVDQPSRKLIGSILDAGLLDNITTDFLQQEAERTNMEVVRRGEQLVMPGDRRGLKAFLQLLDESRYIGHFSGRTLIANSKRPA